MYVQSNILKELEKEKGIKAHHVSVEKAQVKHKCMLYAYVKYL